MIFLGFDAKDGTNFIGFRISWVHCPNVSEVIILPMWRIMATTTPLLRIYTLLDLGLYTGKGLMRA